jgi:hypothetical protein
MCDECVFIEEDLDTLEKSKEVYPNLLNQGCCGGSCQCGK